MPRFLCATWLIASLFIAVAQAEGYQPNWVDFNGDVVLRKDSSILLSDESEITLSFWLRQESLAANNKKYLFYIEGSEGRILLVKIDSKSRLSVAMDSSAPGGPTLVKALTSSVALTEGADQHIYIHKAADGDTTIWVDDAQDITPAIVSGDVGLSTATHIGIMGRGEFYTPHIARGRITDLALYGTTIPRSQFRDIYGLPKEPPTGALIYFGGEQKAGNWNGGINQGSIGSFSVASESNSLPALSDYPYYKLNWVSFDGAASLAMTDTTLVQNSGDLDALTISGWFDVPAIGGNEEFMISAESGAETIFSVSRTPSDQLHVVFADVSGLPVAELWSPAGLDLAEGKHHLVAHFRGGESGDEPSEIFLDGVSAGTAIAGSGNRLGASAITAIGVMGRSSHVQRMTGAIADLRVYGAIIPVEQLYLPKSTSVGNDGSQAIPSPGGAVIELGGAGVYSAHWLDTDNNNKGSWGAFNEAEDYIAPNSWLDVGVIGVHDVSNILVGNTLMGSVIANPYAAVDWSNEGITFERMRVQLHDHFSVGGNVDSWEKWVAEQYDAQGYDLIPWMHYSGDPTSPYYHLAMGGDFKGIFFDPIENIAAPTADTDLGFITANHGFFAGDKVFVTGVEGMTEVNDRGYLVSNTTSDSYWLKNLDGSPVDTSSYGSYEGGGKVYWADTNQPWTSMHFPVEDFVPYSDPDQPSGWITQLNQLKFVPGVEERGGLKQHVLRLFSTNYTEYGKDYETLDGLVTIAKSQGAWIVLAHPFYSINSYRDIRPDAMSIHNGHYYFNTASRGYGKNYPDWYYDNMLSNWEKMLRIDPTIRAVSTNDRMGLHAFGGTITESSSDALDSGKIEAFVADKNSVSQAEAAIRAGAFVAVVDLEDGILYSDIPPLKNNYPRITAVNADDDGITIRTADRAFDKITWYVGNTGSAGNQFAFAKIENSAGNSTLYTQAFILGGESIQVVSDSEVLPVEIDIDQGSPLNEVSPDSDDPILVAVMGQSKDSGDAADFAVTDIDATSLKFGVGGALSAAAAQIVYLDGDPDLDAIFTFNARESGILCEDTDVRLSGETSTGDQFTGSDSISTIGCDDATCHP